MVTRSQQIDVLYPKAHGDQRPVKLCPYMEWTDLLEYSQQAQHCEHKRIYIQVQAGFTESGYYKVNDFQ